jgi:CubicO group peptidase (beta-lactamase class C family)
VSWSHPRLSSVLKIARKSLLIGVVAASVALTRSESAASQAVVPASEPITVDDAIHLQMKEAGIVGMGAAVILNKQVVWTKGYGLADRERGLPFTTDTIMNVGSIAKTVLGVAMMQAVEDGALSLDEDVNRYLPFRVVNPHFPNEKISLRHLATHTSSITDQRKVYASTYHYGGDSPEPLARFLEQYFVPGGEHYSPDNFLNAKPGAMREYSNIGAGLAGLAVERAQGVWLNVITRDRIFKPLGMTRSGWFLSEIDLASHSKLYVSQNGHVIPIPLYGGTTYPDGGLRTTVSDLSRFFVALLNKGSLGDARILKPESATQIVSFQFNDANRPENFPADAGNSGLFWRTKFNGTRVGHGGSDPGIHTEMLCDLSHDVGVVMLINTSLGGEEQVAISNIFNALWKHAETLKSAKAPESGK